MIPNYTFISISVFLACLSGIGPGLSNMPFYIIFIAFSLIYFSFYNTSRLKARSRLNYIYIYSLFFFSLSSLFSLFYSAFPLTHPFAFDSFIVCFVWLLSIYFYHQFSLSQLIRGIILGYFPIAIYSLFIELPLNLAFRQALNSFRAFLGLRLVSSYSPLGFFEESSHLPSVLILVSICSIFYLSSNDANRNHFFFIASISNIIVFLFNFSGMMIFSIYIPLALVLSLLLIFNIVFRMKINKQLPTLMLGFIAFISSIFFLVRDWFIAKIIFVTTLTDHSSSSRFISLISGFYDFSNSCLTGCIGQFRSTRFLSAQSLSQYVDWHYPSLSIYVKNMIQFSGLDITTQSSPVYSFWGYIHSEFGFLALFFFVPWIILTIKGLRSFIDLNMSSSSTSFIRNFFNLLVYLIPLFYLLNMMIGYPRALPFAAIALVFSLKLYPKDQTLSLEH